MLLAKQTIEWEIFLLDNTNINVLLQYKIDYVKQFKLNNDLVKSMHNKYIEDIRKIRDSKVNEQFNLLEVDSENKNFLK